MKEQPNYYAIIPADVRYDKELIQGAKLLYGEITALSNQKGFCWANDMYFANLYSVSKKTIQTWLRSLEKSGYLSREVIYKEGSNEIVSRYIRLSTYPIHEKVHTPMNEKVRDNNTSINTTINNTYNNIDQSSSKEADKVSLKNRFEALWKIYPKKQGKEPAFKSYKKAVKEGIEDSTILNGINAYKKQIELQKTDMQFVKQGSSFFNQRAYLDEYVTKSETTNQKRGYEREVDLDW